MDIKIIEQKENLLFNRIEIKGTIESKKIPSRDEVITLLANKFSVPGENIKIKGIMGKFGAQISDISANIYSSREEKDKIEIKKKKEATSEKKTLEESQKEEAKENNEQVE